MEFEEFEELEERAEETVVETVEKKKKSSQAKIDANERYNKKVYDRIHLSVRKDADINGDAIRAHAEARGESVNSFLLRAVTEAIERDNTQTAGNDVDKSDGQSS